MPGTRSMSPNEQKMTSGRAAMASARSIISSGVTHTGQPGPWISSTSSGSSWSMPLRMIEWVWPPQTSISAHGRVTVAAMSSSSRRGEHRVGELVEVLHAAAQLAVEDARPSRIRARVSWADSSSSRVMAKPTCTIVVLADLQVGHVGQADLLAHAAEVDGAHRPCRRPPNARRRVRGSRGTCQLPPPPATTAACPSASPPSFGGTTRWTSTARPWSSSLLRHARVSTLFWKTPPVSPTVPRPPVRSRTQEGGARRRRRRWPSWNEAPTAPAGAPPSTADTRRPQRGRRVEDEGAVLVADVVAPRPGGGRGRPPSSASSSIAACASYVASWQTPASAATASNSRPMLVVGVQPAPRSEHPAHDPALDRRRPRPPAGAGRPKAGPRRAGGRGPSGPAGGSRRRRRAGRPGPGDRPARPRRSRRAAARRPRSRRPGRTRCRRRRSRARGRPAARRARPAARPGARGGAGRVAAGLRPRPPGARPTRGRGSRGAGRRRRPPARCGRATRGCRRPGPAAPASRGWRCRRCAGCIQARRPEARQSVVLSSPPTASSGGASSGSANRQRRVAAAAPHRLHGAVDDPDHRVVARDVDRAVVVQPRVGDARQAHVGLGGLGGERLVAEVAGGEHERVGRRPGEVGVRGEQQVVQRGVRQQQPDRAVAGRDRRGHRARLLGARDGHQHDRGLRAGEQRCGDVVHDPERRGHGEVADQDRERLGRRAACARAGGPPPRAGARRRPGGSRRSP